MGAADSKKKNLPGGRILTMKIDANMILISNINQKIQNFISLSDLFYDEEQIDKIRSKIINDYKILRASKRKIINACKFLPQDDTEFTNLYKNYNIEITSLTQRYKKIIKGSLLGSRTLAMVSNTATNKLGLHIYDLQDHRSHCFPSEIFHKGSCVVALPNSRLFIYSLGYTYQLGISNNLDLKSSIKTKIPDKFNYLYSGGVYYKNCVYLFGGATSYYRHCVAVRRFDLENKSWFDATPLPEPSGQCTCIIFKDSILICGEMHNKIYKYDLNTETYSWIKNDLIMEIRTPRILFKACSRVYFLERGLGIFESELENEYAYNCISISKHEWYTVSQVKYYNRGAYFFADGWKNSQVFKFDLSTKNITLIKY